MSARWSTLPAVNVVYASTHMDHTSKHFFRRLCTQRQLTLILTSLFSAANVISMVFAATCVPLTTHASTIHVPTEVFASKNVLTWSTTPVIAQNCTLAKTARKK